MNRKHLLGIIGIATAFVLCVFYLFAVALKAPLLKPQVNVAVDLPRGGGVYKGSEVTYRGVRVGRVTELDLTDSGVRANVRLDSTARVPADAGPKVRSLSPVGEQYIDFQPGSDEGRYLVNGSSVRGTAADIPTSLATTAINLDKLIKEIDPVAVKTVLAETAEGLKGSEADLQLLIVQGMDLLNDFNGRWDQTERLIDNGDRLLTLGADLVPDFNSITKDAKTFAAWLRDIDETLFEFLDNAPEQLEELRLLVRDLDGIMTEYLDPYITLADFLVAREPYLRAVLRDYAGGFDALSSAVHGGSVHLKAFLEEFVHCEYGATERSPRDTTRYPLQENGHCSKSQTNSQRGAQWAPVLR